LRLLGRPRPFAFATLLCVVLGAHAALAGSVVWEDEFGDGDVLAPGTQLTDSGVTLDFSTSVVQDNDGGNPDLFLVGSDADFFTISHATTGAHAGFVRLAFNNQNDDPADYLALTISFDFAVSGLQFSILDIDSANGNAWDDGVEVTYNGGLNIRDDAGLFTIPDPDPSVIIDFEPGYEGFEAVNGESAGSGQIRGNVDLDFGTTTVSDVTIRYFSTDDARNNPASQILGVSDLSWIFAIPEPGTGLLVAFGLVVLGATRRRDSRP